MMTDAPAAGMSVSRLSRISDHLNERFIEPGKIAGALPIVYRKGQLAYCEPLGNMDLERGKVMAEDTIFRIYSMSKPITSVALMMLYEHGAFQLNDPVSRFIPEWSDIQVYAAGVAPNFMTTPVERPMFIRDLFTHMSGLTYGFMSRSNVDHAYRKMGVGGVEPGTTLADTMYTLAKIPLEFSPGTRWNYSVSTDVLGYLVEVISRQRFDEYLQQNLFEPLGMVDTGFTVADADVGRFAANYERNPDKTLRLLDDPEDSIYIRPRTFFSGGGGLVSTAADYLRFTRMMLNGGELGDVRILGPKTIEMMTKNYLPNDDDLTRWALGTFSETTYEGYGFGLGFSINLGPERTATVGSAGEYAWGGAASTIFWVDPAEELIVIFMTQFMPSATFNFRGQLKSLVYGAIVD
ncbi:MAG: class A beta-lactamase-related serine hydrolase [Gammaproteobacteria bacterium]|nr:MAG: class A beta-lactamase-related serine hydrolase [Gammaproteobacteria bacterium]